MKKTSSVFSRPIARRTWLSAAAGAALSQASGLGFAQSFPSRPIRVVVPYPPGGPSDTLMRLLSPRLSEGLKTPIVIDNMPGVGGALGTAFVAKAAPDGYTLLMTIDNPLTSGLSLVEKPLYSASDLKPVAIMGIALKFGVYASTGSGFSSFADLVAKGRSQELTFANAGIGTPSHFGALMLAQATGIKVTPVPYRGNAPAVLAVVSGESQASVLGSSSLEQYVKNGKVKPLAMLGKTRDVRYPDVPTLTELGFTDPGVETMNIVFAPAQTPNDVVATLRKEILRAADFKPLIDQMHVVGFDPSPLTPSELESKLLRLRQSYARIVKIYNLKAE